MMKKLLKLCVAFVVLLSMGTLAKAQCDYTLVLNDSWGDGWNGSQAIEVTYGLNVDTVRLDDPPGDILNVSLTVNTNDTIRLVLLGGPYTGGTPDWHNEVSVDLIDPIGAIIYTSGTAPTEGVLFDTLAVCPSCPATANLDAWNIMASSATIGWDSVGTNYLVEYGVSGFLLGAGNVGTYMADSLNLSGLMPNTSYDFYVANFCGIGDTSIWVGPFTFTTPCSAIMAPFTESFDASATPQCWSQSTVGGGTWEFGQAGSADYAATAIDDHTGNGGYFAWVDFSSGDDQGVVLQSPIIDISSLSIPEMTFWLFSSNVDDASYNDLIIETYNGSNWVTADSLRGELGAWTKFTIPLSGMTFGANLIQFRFRAEGGGGAAPYFNDLLIDDINISSKSGDDLSMVSITNPVSDCSLSSSEMVTVTIQNSGANTQQGFDISMIVDGGSVVTETIQDSIQGDSTMEYTFTGTADLSGYGDHTIMVYTSLSGDNNTSDDTVMVTVRNKQTVPPTTQGADVCPAAGSATISSGSNALINWYDASIGGNLVGSGSSLTVDNVNSNITYYAEATAFTQYNVATDTSMGTYGFYSFSAGLYFSAAQDIYLGEVTVYSDTIGYAEVMIVGVDTLYHELVNLVAGENVLSINTVIPQGNNYQIMTTDSMSVGLIRNNAGAVYPYAELGVVSIDAPLNLLGGYYYFFYNWDVRVLDCVSSRSATEITICSSIENKLNSTVAIYPNPTKGSVNVELSNVEKNTSIDVISVTGSTLKSVTVNNNVTTINVSDFSAGIYTVRIQNETGVDYQKLIIE